jgi:hypothetical protein
MSCYWGRSNVGGTFEQSPARTLIGSSVNGLPQVVAEALQEESGYPGCVICNVSKV